MTRSQWSVVAGLFLFILVIFGTLLFQLQVPEMASTPPPPAFLLEDEARAKTVYVLAAEEARIWQSDAQLSSVETVWDDLGPGGILKRDRWTFGFYAPSQHRMAIIRVRDGQAERLRTALVPNPLPALALDQWRLDSTEALEIWWERGGARFVEQHASVSISLKLRMAPEGTGAIWIVTGSSSGEHHVVQIDSKDGTVVQERVTNPAGG